MLHDCHSPSDTQPDAVAAPDAGAAPAGDAAESARGDAAPADAFATGAALATLESVRGGDSR